MAPRLPTPAPQVCAEVAGWVSSSSIAPAASPLEQALIACHISTNQLSARSFSTTSCRSKRSPSSPKAKFMAWMKGDGKALKQHTPGRTNYLYDKVPFPSNPSFKNHPVLSEYARESIYQRVFNRDEPIKVVSADLGVDHRRVAAIVRMKEIEKDWERKGIPLAKPYSRAILEMVPTHSYFRGKPKIALEPINEIHVHGYTMQQLFVPTSESRHFTREDAAKAFHHTMLSADTRMPHKELVEHHRRVKNGMRETKSVKQFVEEARASQQNDEARDAAVEERDRKITTTVPTERFEFRFKKMEVEDVGRDGRSRRGVGWRYGAPFEDRKRAQIKIPTKIG